MLVLCTLPSAQAQGPPSNPPDTYTVTYSGGAATATGPTYYCSGSYTLSSAPNSHVPNGSAYGGGAANPQLLSGQSLAINCKGTITATFTWNGGPNNDPAPPANTVIVAEQVNANWGGQGGGVGSDIPGGTTTGTTGSQIYTATRYSVHGGSSFTVTCTPTASASSTVPVGNQSGAYANVGYTATPYRITLTPSGITKDSSGNLNILIGQWCKASITGFPGNCVMTYQWSVSGATFQMWSSQTPAVGNNPYNPDASYYVDGPGVLTNATAGWYWNDNVTKLENVSCTATVTPPAGQSASITLSDQIEVWKPAVSAYGNGGMMQVTNAYSSNGDYWLGAYPTPGDTNPYDGGMTWIATVASPNPALFGNGSLELVQLTTPGSSFTSTGGDKYRSSNNGQQGLDGSYPYPWDETTPKYSADDVPGMDVSSPMEGVIAYSASLQDSFVDYLMYLPPSSVQYVPVAMFVWSTDGSATIPYSNGTYNWDYWIGGSAGSMTDSNSIQQFVPTNGFPVWTEVITPGYWVKE